MHRLKILFVVVLSTLVVISCFYCFRHTNCSEEFVACTAKETYNVEENCDFSFLNEISETSNLIAIGESTHGSKEFNIYRLKFFEHLARNCGYKFFFLEVDFASAVKLNNYVLTGKGKPKDVLQNQSRWIWKTSEMLDIINWMELYNRNKKEKNKLQLFGIDMAKLFTITRLAKSKLTNNSDKESSHIVQLINKLYYTTSDTSLTDSLIKIISTKINIYISSGLHKVSENDYLILDMCSILMKQNQQVKKADFIEGAILRDKFMAQNIIKIMQFYKKDNKSFLAAHNLHIAKVTQSYAFGFMKYDVMGNHLNRYFGKRYYSMYSDFAKGSGRAFDIETKKQSVFQLPFDDSNLSGEISKHYNKTFFVNLRKVDKKKIIDCDYSFYNVGASYERHLAQTKLKLLRGFDGYLFIPIIHRSDEL